MFRFLSRFIWISLLSFLVATGALAEEKRRVLVLTDVLNEPDDTGSLVRLLTYANEFDIEGLIATTSKYLPDRVHPEHIHDVLDEYAKVRSNLLLHAPGFPTVDFLRARVKSGSNVFGTLALESGQSSQGADWIISVVDRADPRPVYITVWGGPNTLAQALQKVRSTRSASELDKFVAKIRVYTISDQDNSGGWIRSNFPKLFYIYSRNTWTGMSERWKGDLPGSNKSVVSNAWLLENVRTNHGPLGTIYPYMPYRVEGDTPSFLYLIPNGLGDPEKPHYGSWGGRYGPRASYYYDVNDTVVGIDGLTYTSNKATVWRWSEAFQNDFAARMDWNVKSFANANHPPRAVVTGEKVRKVRAGDRVQFLAGGSSDPDGNALSYDWSIYREPSNFTAALSIAGAKTASASFVAPNVVAAQDIHVILAVTDNGTPRLTRYQRVIITVTPSGDPVRDPASEPSPVPTVKPSPSPVPTVKPSPSPVPTVKPSPSPVPTVKPSPIPVSTFGRSFNLGGPSMTLDGQKWMGHSEALQNGLRFVTPGTRTTSKRVTPVPAAPSDIAPLFGSAVFRVGAEMHLVQSVPNGLYRVKFLVQENYRSNYRSFAIVLENQTSASKVGEDMVLGSWKEIGPFNVEVRDGALDIRLVPTAADPHLMGMTVERVGD